MSIRSKINTLFWYLLRPKYYSQLWSLVFQKLKSEAKENTRSESEAWCNNHAISTEEAILEIGGKFKVNIEEKHHEIFEEAHSKVENLPVKMGGGGDMNLLYYLSEYIQAQKVIETGVAHGWSSLAILLSLSQRSGSRLISTDMPYAKMGNENFVGCVVPDQLKNKWTLLRLADKSGLPKALMQFDEIDLCHYDSDKSYEGRKWAYPKLWNKLRSGGLFISDDVGDNIAFKEFAESMEIKPTIVKFKSQYIGILNKP